MGVRGVGLGLVLSLAALSGCAVEADQPNRPGSSDRRFDDGGDLPAIKVGNGNKAGDKDKGKNRGQGNSGRDEEDAPPPTRPPVRTFLVTRIVDGDTIELGNGEMVRLVGIDTPEVGECGFDRASENLARLVLGKQVRLTISDEDRDYYGRLLRYVDVGTMDAGLRLIKNGLAISRYDSRDGYGFHPREPRYIAADRGAPNLRCSAPVGLISQPSSSGNCAAGYSPCVPSYPPDLDCADVNGPIRITGSDPHGFDADGDGFGCDSG